MKGQFLQMKYHPAKKEVEFHRFQKGEEVALSRDSKLLYYINLKGKFVLQDYGHTFFEDIASEFEGVKTIKIQVITTKMDYEDFERMVTLYNAESDTCKIKPTLVAELPDMKKTFSEVKKYGKQAVFILQSYRQMLFDMSLENEDINKSATSFAKQIDEEIRDIKEKMVSLNDNNVSLCFTGVYSSGKSALINALLGYRILPEDIKSETAKMFQISSPKEGENVKIKFGIDDTNCVVEWNQAQRCFEFSEGASKGTEIKSLLDEIKSENIKQHEQMQRILCDLNMREEVLSEVEVLFPVSMDNDDVQFTIYDTPGTDSNYRTHQKVLNESLRGQRQSILIFVAKPDGMEGNGNNALLNSLKRAEEKDSKTSIDVERSLFVINKADGQTSHSRMTLKSQEIKDKEDENFSIKLADKKLFFTSAVYAYAAKAVEKGIATPQDIGLFEAGKYTVALEQNPMGYCFRQNHCATSEYTTRKMLDRCEEELEIAKKKDDAARVLYICSGLYALENEIMQYGEKYASTVKAYAIIDSIDRALTKLKNRADSITESTREEISVIEKNIEELKNTISKEIQSEYYNMAESASVEHSEIINEQLGIDKDTMHSAIVGRIKTEIDKELKGWFFGLGKVRVKEGDKSLIRDTINRIIDDFTEGFLVNRQRLLEQNRDSFMSKIKDTIVKNGNISDAAKKYFLNIPAPMVMHPDNTKEIREIYDSHRRTDKILVFQTEHLDKDGFIYDLEKHLFEVARSMSAEYSREYFESLEALLLKIKTEFELNIDEYSLHMKAMVENKDAMTQLADKVSEVADALSDCWNQLHDIIWKEIKSE